MTENYKHIDSAWLNKNIDTFLKKRVVIITGAGISVSSGIPDFRSKKGLFTSIKETHKTNGKDLFQHRFGLERETRPIYYKFISELKEMTQQAVPSLTHTFLKKYKKYNKKYRIYTQNIDMLEERAGIQPDNLVYLHGNLDYLVCTMCGHKIDYTATENNFYKNGEDIECQLCVLGNIKRKESNIRPTKMGFYHTNIIHYDQPHYDGYKIARLFESDMDLDLFIVMGTSLKVFGVKEMVKRGLRMVRLNNGKGVLVNYEEPGREFKEMFDYFWQGDCDSFCGEILNNIEILKVDKRLSILNVKDEDESFVKIKKGYGGRKKEEKKDNLSKIYTKKGDEEKKEQVSTGKVSKQDNKNCQNSETTIKSKKNLTDINEVKYETCKDKKGKKTKNKEILVKSVDDSNESKLKETSLLKTNLIKGIVKERAECKTKNNEPKQNSFYEKIRNLKEKAQKYILRDEVLYVKCGSLEKSSSRGNIKFDDKSKIISINKSGLDEKNEDFNVDQSHRLVVKEPSKVSSKSNLNDKQIDKAHKFKTEITDVITDSKIPTKSIPRKKDLKKKKSK